jgi:uncharacterized protein YggT (Ycf19 family)
MFSQIAHLLIQTAFGLLVYTLLLRFYMQALRAPFRNPVGQLVTALTNWIVLPARRVIPGLMGFDLATFLLAWLAQAFMEFTPWVRGATSRLFWNRYGPGFGLAAIGLLRPRSIADRRGADSSPFQLVPTRSVVPVWTRCATTIFRRPPPQRHWISALFIAAPGPNPAILLENRTALRVWCRRRFGSLELPASEGRSLVHDLPADECGVRGRAARTMKGCSFWLAEKSR